MNGPAIVTGASSGIGQAVARRLAQRGIETILLARRADRLDQLAGELKAFAPAHPVVADLSDPSRIGDVITGILAKHSPPSILVNNAGIGQYSPFLEQSDAEHRRIMQVNYFAPVTITRAVLPAMLERGEGHVINIASISTKMGPWGHAAYSASKSALVSFTQTLGADYGGNGVHFSYVNPGLIDTEYFQNPSFAPLLELVKRHAIAPDLLAKRIIRLLDHPRLELCVPRHYRILDWIQALSPALLHRLITKYSRPPIDRQPSLTPRPHQSGD